MMGLGVVGLVATVAVVTLGLRLVDRTGTTVADSLELTTDAVVAVEQSVAAAADSVGVASSGIATLTSAVRNTSGSLDSIGVFLDDTAQAVAMDVPDSIDAIRTTMPGLIDSAEVLQNALGALSFIGVDFAPQNPPADSLREVDRGLGDVSRLLRDSSDQLGDVGTDLDALAGDVTTLVSDLERLDSNLEVAAALVESYTSTTSDIAVLVEATADELHAQRREGQVLVLMFGLVLALLTLVPIGIGLRQLTRSRDLV